MQTVAILLPTRKRPQQAQKCAVDVLGQKYPAGVRLSVIVAAQADDAETLDVFNELAKAYKPGTITVLASEHDTNAVYGWNQAYAAARELGADWVVLGADDMEWSAGWLKMALETAKKHDAAFIGLPDGHDTTRKYAPHYMATVSFLDTHLGGVIAAPQYLSWEFDHEACERADKLGQYAETPEPALEHYHPDWGLSEVDETYQIARPKQRQDKRTLTERQRAGYPNNYEPARLERPLEVQE
jgi:glycosyltransferase involved in cell wall biosynthesis